MKRFTCNTCPSRYSTDDVSNHKRHLQSVRHKRIAHGLAPVERVWKCKACMGSVYARSDNFRIHLTSKKHKRNLWRLNYRSAQRERRSTKTRERAEVAAARTQSPSRQCPEPVLQENILALVERRANIMDAKRVAHLNQLMRPSHKFRTPLRQRPEPDLGSKDPVNPT